MSTPEQDRQHVSEREQAKRALFVRNNMPTGGLFAGHDWRVATAPFALGKKLANDIEQLGRVLLQFYKAANLLYRKSVEGAQPQWVARWLELGKPPRIVELQRSATFKTAVPRVIRPDLLLTHDGLSVTELDSVPGGIGLTAWLNRIYANAGCTVVGGADGMVRGFNSIFGDAPKVHIVVSEEAATYRPEMQWLAAQLGPRFNVVRPEDLKIGADEAVYRFFELFDLPNIPSSSLLFQKAVEKQITITPPPKAFLEEKMLLALLWNRNLDEFWRQNLGENFFRRMRALTPRTWIVDPAPLPPHGAIPGLDVTNWAQLEKLSQKERDLILKVSGFSAHAWGARGVFLGSDLPGSEWAAALADALRDFEQSPRVLQKYHHPALVDTAWYDFEHAKVQPMKGRARLCPYYFVSGEGDAARATIGGVLATICPADKKIIHGMTEAVFAPCSA